MDSKLGIVFKKAKYEATPLLAARVLRAVQIEQKRSLYRKLYFSSVLSLLSILGFIPVFKYMLVDFKNSGFYEYFKLIFSDSGLVFSYFKEFAYSLFSVIPVMNLSISLFLLFVFIISAKYVINQLVFVQLNFSRV